MLPLTNGSCRLRVPYSETDILCGIKMEIIPTTQTKPNEGKIEVSVDCSAISTTLVGSGMRVDALETQLSDYLVESLTASGQGEADSELNLKKLCVIPSKWCWAVYIDIVVFGNGGNLRDMISVAAYCALQNAVRPQISIIDTDEGKDFEVNSDSRKYDKFDTNGIPVSVTLTLINGKIIADASMREESCADASLTVSVNRQGLVCCMSKTGNGGFPPSMLLTVLQAARQIGVEMIKVLNGEIKDSESTGKTQRVVIDVDQSERVTLTKEWASLKQ